MNQRISRFANIARGVVVLAFVGAGAASCSDVTVEHDYPEPTRSSKDTPRYTHEGPEDTVFGPGGFNLLDGFGGNKKSADGGGGGGIGVNAFLWRASLDTISFMPLTTVDPFGGVIITDWYSPPEAPNERFKMNVYLLGRELRADALKVTVFRQTREGDGAWTAGTVAAETPVRLENQILTRARQLRVARAANQQ